MRNWFALNPKKIDTPVLYSVISVLFLISFTFFMNMHLMAQGNLLVDPHRVIFDGNNKTMNVSLINNGRDSANYSISFLQYRMTEDGSYEEITSPDPQQYFSDQYIRFFPRTVKLGPNETQVVKLQLVKSEELHEGEYRSHLYFRALPFQKALGEEETKKDSAGISIKIVPVFGISIPVIIRVGEPTTTLNVSNLKLEKTAEGSNRLSFIVHRGGNMSYIGDIAITYIASNGKETKIGSVEGTVIYTPNQSRNYTVELDKNQAIDFKSGTIRIICTTKIDSSTVQMAKGELVL